MKEAAAHALSQAEKDAAGDSGAGSEPNELSADELMAPSVWILSGPLPLNSSSASAVSTFKRSVLFRAMVGKVN